MDRFVKENFQWNGMYLYYKHDGYALFVARFKYKKVPINKTAFVKQLMKAHTPTEYFSKLNAGVAPLQVLIDKDPIWHKAMTDKWIAKHSVQR